MEKKDITLMVNLPLEDYLKLLEQKKLKGYKSWKQMFQGELIE